MIQYIRRQAEGRWLEPTEEKGCTYMEENGAASGGALTEKTARHAEEWTFDRLTEGCAACDVLDAGMLMEWFAGKRAQHPQKTLLFLGRAAQCCADLLGLGAIPPGLDCGHTVFQALVDERRGTVLQCRLIRYAVLAPELEKSLKGRSYLLMR